MAATVIRRLNLDKIKALALGPAHDPSAARRRKMHDLKQKSSVRVKTWRNTLEAQREQELAARTRRMELAEQREQVLEAQEDKIRQTQRRAIIERAHRIQFEESQPVRKLTSAGLLSDVLIERRFCQQVKKLKERDDHLKEEHFQEGVKTEQETATRVDHQRIMQRKLKQKRNACEILEQRSLTEQERRQANVEVQREGDLMRQKIAQTRLEDEEVERKRIRQQHRTKQERLNARREHAEEIAASKAREVDELKQAIQNAQEQQRRMDLLRAKQDERTRVRRELREQFNQRVMDAMPRPPPDHTDVESEKIRAKEQLAEEHRMATSRKALLEMNAIVAAQVEAKSRTRRTQQQQRENDLIVAQQTLADFKAAQLATERGHRDHARQLAQFHRFQMVSKKRERKQDREHEQAQEAMLRNRVDDDDRLKRYAENLVGTYRGEGACIALPVILAVDHAENATHRRFRPQRPTDPF